MAKIGRILFLVGVILGIVGAGGSVAAIVFGVQSGTSAVRDSASGTGQVTVASDAGVEWFIFADTTFAQCRVWGPAETPLLLESGVDMSFDFDNQHVRRQGLFTTVEAGDHRVECDAPTTTTVWLVEGAKVNRAFGWLVASPFLILAAFLGGGIGVVGLILWLVGRSRAKPPASGTPGGYPPGPTRGPAGS